MTARGQVWRSAMGGTWIAQCRRKPCDHGLSGWRRGHRTHAEAIAALTNHLAQEHGGDHD